MEIFVLAVLLDFGINKLFLAQFSINDPVEDDDMVVGGRFH